MGRVFQISEQVDCIWQDFDAFSGQENKFLGMADLVARGKLNKSLARKKKNNLLGSAMKVTTPNLRCKCFDNVDFLPLPLINNSLQTSPGVLNARVVLESLTIHYILNKGNLRTLNYDGKGLKSCRAS